MKKNKKRNMLIYMGVFLALMLQGCSSPASAPDSFPTTPMTDSMSSLPALPTPPPSDYAGDSPIGNRGLSDTDVIAENYSEQLYERYDYSFRNSDEEYLVINENRKTPTTENTLLTFSLKVDTASYRNIVRYIDSGSLPPIDAVRIEEMVNYFRYDQPLLPNDTPFSIYTELGPSPFFADKHLAYIRVKSKDIDNKELPPSNLTFLIDVSGSMDSYDKLPLLKSAFGLLVETLSPADIVSIVTYAGKTSVVLDSAHGNDKKKIMDVINGLKAGGSTAGASGIQAAYRLAENNFIPSGNNRVILATDGDFNVGVSSIEELEKLISEKRATGVYLSVLGVGTDNIKDNKMETLSKYGNGNYNYLDSVATAKKVLVDELAANLFVIADDVKAQVEFNPALVDDYRLIGYENRSLANRDFADDTKDAGEIGAGTDVVLIFELTIKNGNGLKYGGNTIVEDVGNYGDEFFEVRIRYKNPGENTSRLITVPVKTDRLLAKNSADFNFASCVAAFGHLLRNSPYKGDVEIGRIVEVAEGNTGLDDGKLRKEFVEIMKKYQTITR
ncbi:MAG: VWA domain-containing protein [Firmicutes bacterium]|nr:VWA domain-containing protein [Bacillota bacterium]